MNIKELKTLLKENNIHFYSYWDKKRLTAVANEHNLLPQIELEKERSKNDKYDRLRTIRNNPRQVMVEDIETGEIKTFPSIYEASKFLDTSPYTIYYWGNKDGAWKNKYEILVESFYHVRVKNVIKLILIFFFFFIKT